MHEQTDKAQAIERIMDHSTNVGRDRETLVDLRGALERRSYLDLRRIESWLEHGGELPDHFPKGHT